MPSPSVTPNTGPDVLARSATRLLVAALACLVVAPSAVPAAAAPQGRTLHVAPHGEDPDRYVCQVGSEDRPWNNLADAFRCVEPGDTILVHEGTYREVVSLGDSTNPGTADRPILLTGAPGEDTPVIRGSVRVENPSHWTIQDLEIVGDPGLDYDAGGYHPLKILGGEHWTVRRVHVHDAATYGLVRIEPAQDGTPPSHWEFRDSCVHDTIPAHGTPDQPPYPDHNLYVYTGPNAGPGLVEGNVVFGAPNGQNLKLGNSSGDRATDGAENVTVRHNTFVGAAQNVTVVGPSRDNLLVGNRFARVHGEPWYPSVRGIHLRGTGNVVRDNAWSGAAEVVHNRTGVTTGVVDGGGNRQVDGGFDAEACDGFLPTDPAAAPYGHAPRDLSQVDVPVERVAGPDRVATAVAVSREVHDRADVAVIARGDAYPDALASSALAGLRAAPVLLSDRDSLPTLVLDELERLGVEEVVLLGGRSALAPAVERALRDAGFATDRIAGESRFDTATRVADEVLDLRAGGAEPLVGGPVDEVVLVEGANADPSRGWPDAVSAGQLAAASGVPVLLTRAGDLPDETRAWLRANAPARVTVVGGPVAVSSEVLAEVDAIAGDVRRISGPDRYATAQDVAGELMRRRDESTPPARPFVASGLSFPDAMAVGPAAARVGSIVLLYGSGPDAYTRLRDFLAPVDDDRLRVRVVGGPVAVPTTLEQRWALDADGT